MSTGRVMVIALAFGVAVAGATYLANSDPVRAGQVLFVPGPDLGEDRLDARIGGVEVASCVETERGLVVTGRVATGDGVTTIVVAPGPPADPGVAVSLAYAAHAGLVRGAQMGDFRVRIPWASQDSTFVVLADEKDMVDPASVPVGPPMTCPDRS